MIISVTRMSVITEILTLNFLKEQGFKSNPKSRLGVSLPYLERELVPQPGACLMAKSSFAHFTCGDNGNCK